MYRLLRRPITAYGTARLHDDRSRIRMDSHRRLDADRVDGRMAQGDVMNEWNKDMLDRVGAVLLLIGIYLLVRLLI
jgi:hypothetical protein